MAVDNRSTSALFKRAEQLRRWQESETNKTEVFDNVRPRRVNFSDGCIFLAACAAGDKQEVLRLLEKGADIDTANVDGLTALHAACIDDNLDMVEFLVEQGADVNRGDMEGWTALHATASCGFNSIAKFLIDRGADLSLVNNDGDLAIDIADSDEMESLLQREIETRGIDCDASRNEEERRMLEDAQVWLGAGYLADRPHPKTGATALHVASAKGYIKVLSLLLEAGGDINAQDLDGWTPLHAAAHWGQREAVEILCENMAEMDVRNFVGQSPFDVADSSLLRLMDELKRKQLSMKVTNKQTPRKRKTSPHRDHSNKKEKEDQRESDGTSGDESSSDVEDEESSEDSTSSDDSDSSDSDSDSEDDDEEEEEEEENDLLKELKKHSSCSARTLSPVGFLVEKKNKVNKENTSPQIIPTSVLSNKNDSRSLPQARPDSTIDESEVQSWRRPSSLRSKPQDDKNQKEEVSGSLPSPGRQGTRESQDALSKRVAEKDESVTRERLKARSCPALSQLEEEEGRDGGGGVQGYPRPHSRLGVASSSDSLMSSSPLANSQRLSSSDINLTALPNHTSTNSSIPVITQTSIPVLESVISEVPSETSPVVKTNILPSTPEGSVLNINVVNENVYSSSETSNISSSAADLLASQTEPITSSITQSSIVNNPVTSPTHRPLGPSLSTPILPIPSSISSSSNSSSSMVTTTTTTTAGLASLSTNQTTNNKDPRLLARSASLRERIQRNHNDSMARVTLSQEPNVTTSSVVTTNASPPARPIGRSFVPPSRDEESETQRKAHAKMVRSTRRSTQGVTLEDIKSAEQLMKNKQQQLQQQPTTSSPESKESSSLTVSTPSTQGTITTTPSSPSSKPKPDSPTKAEEEDRRPSWRLKVDETDKNKFSLENVRSKDKPEVENDADSVTVQLRKKNPEEKTDEDKESERISQTREGTQAAIQRRKKPKRRSTGRVQVNMDEIDPEKRAQRLAEQQQQQPGDEGSEEEEDEKESSPSERGEASKGSTTSLGSALNSKPSSRASSLGPENGDVDYKKLYEEQLEENFRIQERFRDTETELRQTREANDLNNKKNNTRLAMAEADKREKRALERKLSEMEEELKQLQKLKAENEKLKAENRALTRVVSKLTNSATAGMSNLATLSK